jgi:N-acetylneuraminic acid mutarotase
MNELVNHAKVETDEATSIPDIDTGFSHFDDAMTVSRSVASSRSMRRKLVAGAFCLLALMLGVLSPAASAQTGQWDWVGAKTSLVTFGTEGVGAAGNIPNPEYGAATWTDVSGNVWIFGGATLNNNTLWQYKPSTGYWTWINGGQVVGPPPLNSKTAIPASYGTLGVAAATNLPGTRYATANWIDQTGRFWMFGGWGSDTNKLVSDLNDLWMFDPSTGYWTWMAGSSAAKALGIYGSLGVPNSNNAPGARDHPAFWTDSSGNFWLFGGYGYGTTGTQAIMNDLWEFNTQTLQWIWMGGSSSVAQLGTFGTQGVAAAANTPSAMYGPISWTDNSGNFWLFGGTGYAQVATSGSLNDLWKYSPSTGQWTWVWGDGVISKLAVYGAVGLEASTNKPGPRINGGSFVDGVGDLWLFGGYGTTATTSGALSDIWRFNPSSGNWTWMGGDTTANKAAVYNAQGVANANNDAGERVSGSVWLDLSGNFWLFGGSTAASSFGTPVGTGVNDLWQYQFSAAAQPVINPAGGTYNFDQTVTITDSTPGALMYYTTDGTTPTIHSNLYSAPIAVNTPQTINAIAVASGYSYSPVATAAYVFVRLTAATPVISPASGTYAPAPAVTITDATSGATIYYTTNGSTPTTSSPIYSGPISVTLPATVRAIAVASQYSNSAVAAATYTMPTVATPVFTPGAGVYNGSQSVTITDATTGATIYYTTDGTTPTTNSPIYSGSPIGVSLPTVIQAIAAESGYTTSSTAQATYTIVQPTPAISSITLSGTVLPYAFTPGAAFAAMVNGSNFVPTSVVYLTAGGVPLATQYVSSKQLTATIPANLTNIDPATTDEFSFYIKTPAAASASNTVYVAVISVNYKSMPITMSPTAATVTAGGSASYNILVGNGSSLVGSPGAVNVPAGITQGWIPDPYLANTGVLTLNTSSTTPKGTYTILVLCGGSVPTTNPAGMLLPILLLPLLLLRKRLAAKGTWLTLCAGFILLVSALSLGGCAKGPSYNFTTTSTNEAVNANQITLTVQ